MGWGLLRKGLAVRIRRSAPGVMLGCVPVCKAVRPRRRSVPGRRYPGLKCMNAFCPICTFGAATPNGGNGTLPRHGANMLS